MKKILLFIGLLGIVSCTPMDESEAIKNQRFKIRTSRYKYTFDIFKFKFEGHTYICIDANRTMNGVVHDPDCRKCKSEGE